MTYVILDGDFRLGQYKQLDGYPEGLGLDLLRFLAHIDCRLLKTKFDLCCPFYPSLEEVYCRHDEAELIGFKFDPKGPGFSPVNHFERLFERGAGTIIHVPIDSFVEFDKDSHADIEFIYIVNLDTWRFELLDHHYGGLNIISSYDLDNLPDRRTFLQDYCQFVDTMNSGSHGSYSHYILPGRSGAIRQADEENSSVQGRLAKTEDPTRWYRDVPSRKGLPDGLAGMRCRRTAYSPQHRASTGRCTLRPLPGGPPLVVERPGTPIQRPARVVGAFPPGAGTPPE